MDAEKIVANSEILSPTYLPEKLLHREKERLQLKNSLANSIHSAVLGSFGSGKTVLARIVAKEFNTSKNGYAAYIDCAIYQTTYSILKELLPKSELVFYRSNYELIRELRKYIRDNRVSIILDNFDQLKDGNLISRLMSLGICVILLADNEESFAELDIRVKSSILSIIRLSDYTTEQAFDLIKSRAEKALTRWSYTDAVLNKIAENVQGNITFGLNALKAGALKAESEGKKTVEESDIDIENDCPGPKLTRDEKIIFEIMQEWKSLPSSRLHTFYIEKSRHPKGERAFRNYMKSLCSKGLVEAIGDKRGRIYEFKGDENVQGHGQMHQD
jgi:Cdc6-like AAA superfamily ATPase